MTGFLFAFAAAIAAAQPPVPPINYSLPGQATPAPLTIPPNAEILPFQNATVISRPSAAARHYLLAAAPAIPGRGLAFTVRCLLDRANGRVILCRDPSVPEAYRDAAIRLGSLYQFQLNAAQTAAIGPLAVTIQDRIAPADVRPAARLFTFTTRPAANVTFAQVMSGQQSQDYYPRGALDMGVPARVRIDCQVQPDLSLFCLNPVVAPDPNVTPYAGEFQLAALQLSGWFRAGPTLSSGAPAPGTIFRTTIIFNVPQ
jgi:hypothetical protein